MSLATSVGAAWATEQNERTRKQRLLWVMLLRIGLITVLLGTTLILNYRSGETVTEPTPKFLLGIIAGTYLCTIVYAIWYRLNRALQVLIRVQLTMDLFLWASLTYATGGIASGFSFLFHLWVIVAAVGLGGRASYYSAWGSSLMLLFLGIAMTSGWLEPLRDQNVPEFTEKEIYYYLAVNVIALFVVAALVNSLVARLERTGKGLETERTRRADLAQLHADMIRSLTVGIGTTTTTGEIVTLNPAGLDILGCSIEEIEGFALGKWLPEVPLSTDDAITRGTSVAVRGEQTEIPIEYIVAPLVAADGSLRGSIVVFSDLSEVKQLEEEVERSRRLAALGKLAASLAHEIRNPLGAISGCFQMIMTNTRLHEEDKGLLEIISRELKRMERLVGDMLQYARPNQINTSTVNLGALAGEVLEMFLMGQEHVGRDVRIAVHGTEQDLVASVDHARISQVIWNLLRNAAQATEEGDEIVLDVRNSGQTVQLEVRDSGRGITKNESEKLFDPFFSTRERGLGLGLALCKRIVEEHKGTIEAISGDSKGSIFRVTLPRESENVCVQ